MANYHISTYNTRRLNPKIFSSMTKSTYTLIKFPKLDGWVNESPAMETDAGRAVMKTTAT